MWSPGCSSAWCSCSVGPLGVVLAILNACAASRKHIAFGPFLAVGSTIAVLFRRVDHPVVERGLKEGRAAGPVPGRFGPMLRYLTAGESHGQALVVIVEGLPAGLPITVEEIRAELARRRLGYGRGPRMRFEQDEVTLLGGVRHGRTLGSPVAIEIGNTEWARQVDEEMSTRRRADREAAHPAPARATPTWPACRSTASTTPATCSSGPRRARRRPGSRPARCAKALLAHIGVDGAVAT